MGDVPSDPDVWRADYDALRADVGAVEVARDVLRVAGPDAVAFLQGQLSQDVAGLALGASAWSFLLQPQGKVDALVRVTRTGEEECLVDVDGGFGEATAARLRRFKLRVRADLEPLAWSCLALRGPRAPAAAARGPVGEAQAVAADWPGLAGVDLLGPAPVVPEGVRACGRDAYEAVRVEAGWPAMGAELDERTIPAEAGVVDRAVSFTKGCYTGQELVARIDSRGNNVPRRLRAVVVGAGAAPVGAAVTAAADAKALGALTSVARSPRLGTVALAYVHRDVEPPAEATVRWEGGSAPARVEALPLLG